MQVQDALLPMLIAGTIGLLIGVGLSAALKAWRRRRAAGAAKPVAPRWQESRWQMPTAAGVGGTVRKLPSRPGSRLALLPVLPQAADLLLVDDSAVARAKLRRLFEAAGYQVQLACDGVEALALLAKGRYSLMITDLEMPNMDGIALINACRAEPQTARMPMLAITGHEGLRAKFNECRDICGIHRKPWVDDILLSHVATLVATRRHERVPAAAVMA